VSGIIKFLVTLDRRWIFLAMAISVVIPIMAGWQFPETPMPHSQVVFDGIERLPSGSKVLLAFDYDPGSAPELQPMATAMTWHCAKKKLKLYFIALWPLGPQMINDTVDTVLKRHYPEYKYGRDYVNLGFKPGNEGVIKVVASNLRELYTTDHLGTSLTNIDMCAGVKSVADMDLVISVSAGYPGTKEWIQYATTPLNKDLAAGCTGVQAPLLYPYIPNQMFGMLGAIKGAAEYEEAISRKYPEYREDPQLNMGRRRMGPQLIAHCLIVGLIILGNIVMAATRKTGVA